MRQEGLALILAVAVVLAAARAPGAEKDKDDAGRFSGIVRYVGAKESRAPTGVPAVRVYFAPLTRGRSISALIANKDAQSKVLDPNPAIFNVVKGLKKGDLVTVTIVSSGGWTTLTKIERYELKPGEDEPNGFLFVRAEEEEIAKETYLVVTLQKFGQETKAVVPSKKNEAGETAPDEALAAQLTAFKIGDVVEVETQKKGRLQVLKSICKYTPPVVCEFVKLVEKTVDEVEHVGVEVKIDGEPQTLFVPNMQRGKRSVPDPRLRSVARKLKPGDWIEAKIRTEGDRKLVTRITKTKKKDVEKGPSDEEKKDPAEKT